MSKRKGIEFIAYLAVNKTTVIDIGSQPDAGGALLLDLAKTHFLVRQGYFDDMHNLFNVDFNVIGKGFEYRSLFPGGPQVPFAGTVKEVDVTAFGDLAIVLRHMNVSVPKLAKMLEKDDPFLAFPKLLKGDDTVIGSEFDDTLYGFKGRDNMWARGGNDIVDGGKDNDVNDGGPGNDYLIDVKGEDRFQFSTELAVTASLNLSFNYDRIKFFGAGDDIYLKESIFPGIGDKLDKSEFVNGPAPVDGNDYIIWNKLLRILYYDRDGSGTTYESIPFATVENDANFNHKSFVMGVMYDYHDPY